MNVGIVGGGAAGFFAAINVKENYPDAHVVIFEKSTKLLSKVKISGGGRCNVTNGCSSIVELCKAYPRGAKQLKKMFHVFNTTHAYKWFESRGVPLVVQDDNCIFPKSQDSQSIIDCFIRECERFKIEIRTSCKVEAIQKINNSLELIVHDKEQFVETFDKVIVTTGGAPKKQGLKWLSVLGHTIVEPVPSLFSINLEDKDIRQLMGLVVKNVMVKIPGTKLKADGDLLITHWGLSGPAILKLSSFGARIFNEKKYKFIISINWINETNSEKVISFIEEICQAHAQKQISNYRPYQLPERLWLMLIERCGLHYSKRWSELGKKGKNKLSQILMNDEYAVSGKSAFTEEFVTCGGVSLLDVNTNTMESKVCPNLYFAGEVLDIDAITGGFNFQAAWTTAFVASKLM